jgi:hypothetical protein
LLWQRSSNTIKQNWTIDFLIKFGYIIDIHIFVNMKMKYFSLIAVMIVSSSLYAQIGGMIQNGAGLATSAAGAASDEGMCWMETITRGAGTIPDQCSSGKKNENGLCYVACPTGYTGEGPVCWQNCPTGYTNNAAFCAKPKAYSRTGFAWDIADGVNDNGMYSRCQKVHGSGNCEKNGAIVYPKCKTGFSAVGCCVCSPICLNAMVDIGVSCTKKTTTRGAGTIPDQCSGGKKNEGGLCYTSCPAGFKGIGPVCWNQQCPTKYPTHCGMGCAFSDEACGWAIFDQVSSVGEFILNIATFGTGGAITKVATTTAKTVGKTVAKTVSKEVVKASLKSSAKAIGKEMGETVLENTALTCVDAQLTGEFDWYSLDPTGIANIVKAFNHPLCKDVK